MECTDLPKFTAIEPSQLTPAISSILEKLEDDFVALEAKMAERGANGEGVMGYDEVLPVVEKMQHPLGECLPMAGDALSSVHAPRRPIIDILLVLTTSG